LGLDQRRIIQSQNLQEENAIAMGEGILGDTIIIYLEKSQQKIGATFGCLDL